MGTISYSLSPGAFSLSLSAAPTSASVVRSAVRRFATEAGLLEGEAFDLQVSIGEAVSNAIQHAYASTPGTIRVKAWLERDTVHAEVEDFGTWRRRRALRGRGRGLRVMTALAKTVDIQTGLSGTKVSLAFDRGESREPKVMSSRGT